MQTSNARAEALIADFRDPSRRVFATRELGEMGDDAVATLAAFFDGSMLDPEGYPYSRQSEVVCCALVSVRILGPRARSLESLVLSLTSSSSAVRVETASALASLRSISADVLAALARMLTDSSFDVALQAGDALRTLDALTHPVVASATETSQQASRIIHKMSQVA